VGEHTTDRAIVSDQITNQVICHHASRFSRRQDGRESGSDGGAAARGACDRVLPWPSVDKMDSSGCCYGCWMLDN
jgi:hypothetical protein